LLDLNDELDELLEWLELDDEVELEEPEDELLEIEEGLVDHSCTHKSQLLYLQILGEQ